MQTRADLMKKRKERKRKNKKRGAEIREGETRGVAFVMERTQE